ncbi:MAG: hypothetical protein ACOVPA_04715, partial [Rubrivivax sp.]
PMCSPRAVSCLEASRDRRVRIGPFTPGGGWRRARLALDCATQIRDKSGALKRKKLEYRSEGFCV